MACVAQMDGTTSRTLRLFRAEMPEGEVPKRLWVASVGAFDDEQYGAFEITREDLESIVAAHNDEFERHGKHVAIDIDHSMLRGANTVDDRKARGWVTSMSIEGDTLWADVEWVDEELATALAKDQFRFTSPVLQFLAKDINSGDVRPAVLDSIGVTNRPRFTHGAPIQAIAASREVADAMAKHFSARVEDDSGAVRLFLSTENPMSDTPKVKTLAFSLDGEDREIQIAEDQADSIQAVIDTAVKAEAKVIELSKSLEDTRAKLPAAGQVVMSREDLESLKRDATAGAEANAKLLEMEAKARREAAFDRGQIGPALVEDPKVVVASKSADTWETFLLGREPNSAWNAAGPRGVSGPSTPVALSKHDAEVKAAREIKAMALSGEHKDWGKAKQAWLDNPENTEVAKAAGLIPVQ